MASLKDIRRRITSVKSTQQITRAMKMVSAAKLRRAQELIVGARPFADKVEELTSRILQDLEKTSTDKTKIIHPLLRQDAVERENEKPKAYMVAVSSDKGLCGAYNTNIIKLAFKHYKVLSATHDVTIICVGRKVSEAFRKKGINTERVADFWSAPLTQTRVSNVTMPWIEGFIAGKIDRIDFVYTEFRSAIAFTARIRTILPFERKINDAVLSTEVAKGYVFKPSKEGLLQTLLPKQVVLQMYRCFADALASEFGARMTSMDNATRAASDMISDLSLIANRVRQATITTELMEIVGGAEALKG